MEEHMEEVGQEMPTSTSTPPEKKSGTVLKILLWIFIPLSLGMAVVIVFLLLKEPEMEEPLNIQVPTEGALFEGDTEEEDAEEDVGAEVEIVAENNDIDVTWLDESVKVDAATLGISNFEDYAGITDVNEAFETYQVGTTNTPPFANCKMLVISRGLVFADDIYRVADCREFGGLELFSNLSSVNIEADEEFFNLTSDYDIQDLQLPDELSVEYDGSTVMLNKEPFSPASLYSDFTNGKTLSNERGLTHTVVGDLLEDVERGYFVARRPDHTPELYSVAFPFGLETDTNTGAVVASSELTLDFNDGESFTGRYTPVSAILCPPREYDVMEGMDGRLTEAGTFGDGTVFYETTDPEDEANVDSSTFSFLVDSSREDQLAEHMFIFFEDDLGRIIRLRNTDFFPGLESECPYRNSVLSD